MENVGPMDAIAKDFHEVGYHVLRGALTEAQVDRLARPIRAAFVDGDYDGCWPDAAYPTTGQHTMGPRILEKHPEIAEVSLAHPAIVEAVESLLGEPATLAQYWSIMRTPGTGVGDAPFVHGNQAHMDYKPWRCVGSFLKWMFAVIPFVDYTETAGPLCIAPGTHRKSKVLASDGRVHPVDVAMVTSPADIVLDDPGLKKGDVVLMDGFTWHEARPNTGPTDRSGLYMKYHARSSPPACGPTIFPSQVHDHLRDDARHLVPHHRGDGRYASLREGLVGGIDEARVLIEDDEQRVLLIRDGADGWALPCFPAEEESGSILDACNVMGSVFEQARGRLGLQLSWLSWLLDLPGAAPDGKGERRCRVYGHRLSGPAPQIGVEHRWMSAAQLEEAQLECGGQERRWLRMWQQQEDEHGRAVTRGFGFPKAHDKRFPYNRNGNPPGHCRVGVFDGEGLPVTAGVLSNG